MNPKAEIEAIMNDEPYVPFITDEDIARWEAIQAAEDDDWMVD